MPVLGCDTFVVLPPCTAGGEIIFGKNADRPAGEVQEILYQPAKTYEHEERLRCTYIEVDQASSTYAVLLSKPAWMWGGEMGANSCGVVIGNEAVWTVLDEPRTETLLGMDLLRLGLERSSTSSVAVGVITSLLEQYGQGGPCSDIDSDLFYHNSFLIADRKEAWVLETVGQLWAAERVASGYRNISNCLSIGSNINVMSIGLVPFTKEQKLWSGEGEFSFKDVFSQGECSREAAGYRLLEELTSDNQFDFQRMLQVLRDKESGICMPSGSAFETAGSWVSVLNTHRLSRPPSHWVTATPDPSTSLFKPFVFSPNPKLPSQLLSPTFENDPAKTTPRFQTKVDRRHVLYKLNQAFTKDKRFLTKIKEHENSLVKNVSSMLLKIERGSAMLKCCDDLLKNSVEDEIEIYTQYN